MNRVCSLQEVTAVSSCNQYNCTVHSPQKWSFPMSVVMCLILIFTCRVSEEYQSLDGMNVNRCNAQPKLANLPISGSKLREYNFLILFPRKHFKKSQVEHLSSQEAGQQVSLRSCCRNKRLESPAKVLLAKQQRFRSSRNTNKGERQMSEDESARR